MSRDPRSQASVSGTSLRLACPVVNCILDAMVALPEVSRHHAVRMICFGVLQAEFSRAKQAMTSQSYRDAAGLFIAIENKYPGSAYGDAVLTWREQSLKSRDDASPSSRRGCVDRS